jgi:uncharacterized protein DUF4333
VIARRWPRLLAGAALGVALVAGCGDEPGLDVAAVESYLAASQASTFGADAEVGRAHCKGDHVLEEGMEMRCTLAVADASVPYRLTLHKVHSTKVAVDVALQAVVLRSADVQDFVRDQLPKAFRDSTVDCGHQLLVTEVGETVDCTVSSGAQSKPVAVKVEDDDGRISIS